METILFIDDQTSGATNAGKYAALLASRLNARLLIWKHTGPVKNCYLKLSAAPVKTNKVRHLVTAGTGYMHSVYTEITCNTAEGQALITGYKNEPSFHLSIAALNVGLIVMGIDGPLSKIEKRTYGIMAYAGCPLLLVPQNVNELPKRLGAYLCDMRFCRTEIARFFDRFCHRLQINGLIAQISASGLPPVMDDYSNELYEALNKCAVNRDRFTLLRISERNVHKVADVLVNTLRVEMLAMAYRRYHFYSLTDSNDDCSTLHCPLLLFPM